MEKTLRSCADQIVEASIRAVLPDEAVRRALKDFHPEGRTVLVATHSPVVMAWADRVIHLPGPAAPVEVPA